jgi:Arc/MetJ-type ribon-helix-helix transcriptional regulator
MKIATVNLDERVHEELMSYVGNDDKALFTSRTEFIRSALNFFLINLTEEEKQIYKQEHRKEQEIKEEKIEKKKKKKQKSKMKYQKDEEIEERVKIFREKDSEGNIIILRETEEIRL